MAESFGELVRGLRLRAGRAQDEQAAVMCEITGEASITRAEISRYERGRRVPRPRLLRVYAQSFGIPEGELFRAAAAERAASQRPSPHRYVSRTVGIGGSPTPGLRCAESGNDVRRREFAGAAALGLGMAGEPWGRLAYALNNPEPISAETAAQLHERAAALFAAEERLPARRLYQTLVSHLDHLATLLPTAGSQRRGLLVQAAETAALAGWLAFDLGETHGMRHYYETATQAAAAAGHPPTRALVLAYTSYAVSDPHAACALLREAEQHVRGAGCATARSWIAAREAEESAAMGDREGAMRAIERAQAVYDHADPAAEQPWVRFFSRARLTSMTVAAYARLDHPDLVEVSEAAMAALPPADLKVKAVILGDVATACVSRGDFSTGAEIARQALDVTCRTETALGRQRLQALAEQLPAVDRVARELSEELRSALR